MQKTASGKKVFLPTAQLRPSQKLSRSLQKFITHKGKPNQPLSEQLISEDGVQRTNKSPSPSFQYYFFQRNSSSKQLNKLRNSKSVKDLLQREKEKQRKLQRQIDDKQQGIEGGNQYQNSDKAVPFYKKYKPTAVKKNSNHADYGLYSNKPNLKRQTSPNNFQKVNQNKKNLHKYRETKGMISPQKLKTQQNGQNQTDDQINKASKYNLSLNPYDFKNTIEGAIATSSDRYLRMDLDKLNKINNVNKIWYNEDIEIDDDNSRNIKKTVQQKQRLKKCRSFDNYKGHTLFDSKIKKPKVPAFQHLADGKSQAKRMGIYNKWRTQNNIDMQKMIDRPPIPEKLGTNLDYNVQGPKKLRSPSNKGRMGISSSERKLVFTRQLINPQKGR